FRRKKDAEELSCGFEVYEENRIDLCPRFFSLLCDPVCTKGQKRKGNSENRMLLRGLYLPQV
ncbi:hypothetical protein, partial [Phocaeicola vulgatus]|uniref:hypothetical protein n=1 Tax=Phocaeicola vulgatus TaxID=821 RepID=UPI001C70AB3B